MKIGVCNLLFIPYVVVVINVDPIRERFSTVAPFLDERGRRLVAAAEAFAAGYGGITAVAKATGMAPSTIGRGLKELAQDEPLERVRRPGAGRKPAIVKSLPSRKRGTRPCLAISMRWSNQRAAAIPNRRCGGPARACGIWPRHCSSRGTRRAAPWWPSCSTRQATACKATARPRKATAILTGTPNSPTSTSK